MKFKDALNLSVGMSTGQVRGTNSSYNFQFQIGFFGLDFIV
jgi:hypothetical protein